MANEKKERFIEIDFIRGFALSLMILFHILWDLDYYGLSPLDQQIYGFAQYVPMVFFSLVGICLVLSSQHKKPWQNISRGLLVFGAGMLITAVTMVFLPDKPVTFGV
ncbi:MAG: heparan-alpha-glucosaminide N-acetyltransferase domain-containing protein, partial [Euryarchaeota archaeon]|nr:heparan-alpha-glucosaminide N-acetyltransferase domain-containing protein [Euryarchaeota archaeon]